MHYIGYLEWDIVFCCISPVSPIKLNTVCKCLVLYNWAI